MRDKLTRQHTLARTRSNESRNRKNYVPKVVLKTKSLRLDIKPLSSYEDSRAHPRFEPVSLLKLEQCLASWTVRQVI